MSRRMRKNAHFLSTLERANRKQQKGIIEGANNELIHCLCECAVNILKGNVPLSLSQKRKLSQSKKHLRSLADKTVSIPKKKKLLVQKGGFLPALIGPILGALASFLK